MSKVVDRGFSLFAFVLIFWRVQNVQRNIIRFICRKERRSRIHFALLCLPQRKQGCLSCSWVQFCLNHVTYRITFSRHFSFAGSTVLQIVWVTNNLKKQYIIPNGDSHWTTRSTFWLSIPQEFLAEQVYCPAIVLLMLYNDNILPLSITKFDTLTHKVFGEGKPESLQTRFTSWPSVTTMLLLSTAADALTGKEKVVFPYMLHNYMGTSMLRSIVQVIMSTIIGHIWSGTVNSEKWD